MRPRPLLLLAALVLALPGARAADTAAAARPPAVAPENFLPALTAQLAAHFRVDGELQLDLLRTWAPVRTPDQPWEMVVVTPPAMLVPQTIVRVRLVSAGRNLGEWNLPVHLQLWNDAWVARQPLERGATLDLAALDRRRTDFLRDKDAVPASADVASLSVARGVPAGSVLAWRDVVRRQLVQRGEFVEVVATSGPLTITLKGVAMQSGALGDAITIRNPESRRDFTAVVTSERKAVVQF